MIKRIQQIKNIGTFSNFVSSPPIQFEKLTFIYGLNTYGKTTFADILESIKSDDFSSLQSRKSIPIVSSAQNVALTFKHQAGTQEQRLSTNNGSWQNNQIGQNIQIFGTEFIHKHLFTGLSVERANKENFTQFILGDSGVALAQEIKESKQQLNTNKRGLLDKKPNFIKDKEGQELEDFLSVDISELNLEELKADYSHKQLNLNNKKERLLKPELILSKATPSLVNIPSYIAVEEIEKINILLNSEFNNISDDALEKVTEHISSNFLDSEIAEDWLQTGNKNIKNNNCSFCGQNLSSVQILVDSYNQLFNEEYNLFIDNLLTVFYDSNKNIHQENYSLSTLFTGELNKIKEFEELIDTEAFSTQISDLEMLLANLDETNIYTLKNDAIDCINALFDSKKLRPHSKCTQYQGVEMTLALDLYKKKCASINSKISQLADTIVAFKQTYQNLDELRATISENEITLAQIDYKIKRIEQNGICLNYISSREEITSMESSIVDKEEELNLNQSVYLTSYFENINELFNQFGSRNFSLEKSLNRRGHQPVYSLNVKYHGEIISENSFSKVFSESDKRALALAVFWTKIKMMPMEEKSKTILVLDDPVTSFDDNRVSKTINIFKNSIDEFSQVIVLTHYSSFLKIFFEKINRDLTDIKFLEIKKNNETSSIANCNFDKFIKSEYQLSYEKITGYINSEHENCIKADLRKFLETSYLPHFFPDRIIKAKNDGIDISTLSSKIDVIFEGESDVVRTKFHSFRENTNPDSHIYTSNNTEDVKNFANEMMTFLYSQSFSNN